ncbi:TetR/AcrR family transcriptional regulator [Streptomyces sp. NRRL F-4489]|uniref:TetR/AcrR family transcriptional regulator n=1 Tax=Streptomyces sp. NRRL F-4489 TaxID=1609095 RepID=UPI001F4621A6|nr:TetR/AcrR family transcriptional regulator [Streptomyces sp. NRRL F-4489]
MRAAIADGPPPLGPGAPARERLIVFLDGLGAIAERNAALLSAHEQACASDKFADPSYQLWHRHLSGLVAEARPGLDSDFAAHALLAAFDGELVRRMAASSGEPRAFTRAVTDLAPALVGPV